MTSETNTKKTTQCMQGLYGRPGPPSSLLLMRGKKGKEGGPVLCHITAIPHLSLILSLPDTSALQTTGLYGKDI